MAAPTVALLERAGEGWGAERLGRSLDAYLVKLLSQDLDPEIGL